MIVNEVNNCASIPLLLNRFSVCVRVCVCGTPPGSSARSDWPNGFEKCTTWHQSVTKALTTSTVVLMDWSYTHYADDGTCPWGSIHLISDRRRRSAGKGPGN